VLVSQQELPDPGRLQKSAYDHEYLKINVDQIAYPILASILAEYPIGVPPKSREAPG
jgi:hypothetical protein